jgi:hypothetical protein
MPYSGGRLTGERFSVFRLRQGDGGQVSFRFSVFGSIGLLVLVTLRFTNDLGLFPFKTFAPWRRARIRHWRKRCRQAFA